MEEDKIKEKEKSFTYEDGEKKLDYILMQYILVNSLDEFIKVGKGFPFVEVSEELTPNAKDKGYIDTDLVEQNTGLIIYTKEELPKWCDDDIDFSDDFELYAETLKYQNLMKSLFPRKSEHFDITHSYLEKKSFVFLLRRMCKLDGGLLIHKDTREHREGKYSLTHCKGRINTNIAHLAKELAIRLGYMKNKRDKKWHSIKKDLKKKFCECYGAKLGSNRRIAGALAAQRLTEWNLEFKAYVGSCQARSLIKIDNKLLTRYCLLKMNQKDTDQLENQLKKEFKNIDLRSQYVFSQNRYGNIFIFKVEYEKTPAAILDENFEKGEREFSPKAYWRLVTKQSLVPNKKHNYLDELEHKIIYKKEQKSDSA